MAACGHALLACKSNFRFQPPDFEVFSDETVENRRQAEETNRERDALVGGGAEWFRQLWEARQMHKDIPDADTYAPPEPVRSRLAHMLRTRIADPETQEDEALWRQVTKALPDDPHLPLLLAESWGLVPVHHNYWLDRADYDPGDAWSNTHQAEIDHCRKVLEEDQLPLPEIFLSIDSATTHDIDDAFHVESRPEGGWLASVALACPAWNWPFGGALDRATAHRATSVYLPEGDHHMLPESLGIHAYSLHANMVKPALVLRCEVGENGEILGGRPECAWIRLAANLTYTGCEQVLNHAGTGTPAVEPDVPDVPDVPHVSDVPNVSDVRDEARNAAPHADVLRRALALAQSRIRHRVTQGAVIIDRPEAEFYLVGTGAETRVFLKESACAPRAQLLVSELMILANAVLASFAVQHNLPLLFRTQDVAVPREFAGIWTTPQDIAKVVKTMTAASLETAPRPHAGMGLAAYSTVTSPLRRYSDLLNEAQTLHFLNTGQERWTRDDMQRMLAALHIRLEAAGQIQRFRSRYWKYLYIQQQARAHGDACPWDAVVAEENDAWVSVSLAREALVIRGKRSLFGEKVFPGQKLTLRLGKVNALRGEVSILAVNEA